MKRTNAPRIATLEKRVKISGRWPDDVKKILRIIARDEKTSSSWVAEQMIIRGLGLDIEYKVVRRNLK